MTGDPSTIRLVLRDDDVCWHTPLPLLQRLRDEVWQHRPIVEAVIPRVGSAIFKRRTPFGSEGVRERDLRQNAALVDHLRREFARGDAEVAVHGVTHLDHPGPRRMLAEFEVAVDEHIDRLIAECNALRGQFGSSFFVPPHNAAHPDVVARCLEAGFDVCRSMTPDEVRAVAGSDDRDQAKALQPYRWRGDGLELFQTIILSRERIARNQSPAEAIAAGVVEIAKRSGMAVITLHWWDFIDDGGSWDPSHAAWMQRFLAAVESQVTAAGRTPLYSTLAGVAAGFSPPSPAPTSGLEPAATPSLIAEETGVH